MQDQPAPVVAAPTPVPSPAATENHTLLKKRAGTESQAQADPLAAEKQDLQKAIEESANDRAALVRNLEAFLKKYPDTSQKLPIYRAIVEATLQLQDYPKATEYAERSVALSPQDVSMALVAIQLLERGSDAAGWKRAVSYASRIMEELSKSEIKEKSPRVSAEDWEAEKRRDNASLLIIRGRLYQKLNNLADARKDFEASYALVPGAAAAEKLGEVAEAEKKPDEAIREYALAFALADDSKNSSSRRELRQKLGNVWRLAHGSEDGLGDYLLHAFDDAAAASRSKKVKHNENAKELYDFVLRKIADDSKLPLKELKGKVLVLNFWTTWCGPCQAMEPHFDKAAANFLGNTDVKFFAVNCDEDESLVTPFLEEMKPHTEMLYSDGLDRMLNVESFPTTVILDREGKIAYRASGFDESTVDRELLQAVKRVVHGQTEGATPAAPSAAVASEPPAVANP